MLVIVYLKLCVFLIILPFTFKKKNGCSLFGIQFFKPFF
jgi:hypothetical protein